MSKQRQKLRLSPIALLSLAIIPCFADTPTAISGYQDRAGGSIAVAGDVVELLGTGLADPGLNPATSWPLPLLAGTTTVSCAGYAAPILSAAPNQIWIQLPWELAGMSSVPVVVTHNGSASPAFTLNLNTYSPEIVSLSTGTVTAGGQLTIAAFGLGPRNYNPDTGAGPSINSLGSVEAPLLVTVGGIPAPVIWTQLSATGNPSNDAGIELITAVLPVNVPSGSVPVVITESGSQSNPFTITVNPAAVGIEITPPSLQIAISSTIIFKASVRGSSDTSVYWSVDPTGANQYGGAAGAGLIDQSGFFDANYFASTPSWGIVRATHSSGAFATALVQLLAPDKNFYQIVPQNPVLVPGQSVTFSLVDSTGSPATAAARWLLGDDVGSSSTYTAPVNGVPPSQVTVAAWDSRGDTIAVTEVFIDPPRAQITGTIPAIGHVGESLTVVSTAGYQRSVRVWFTMSDGSVAPVTAAQTGQGPNITVPHGAVSGPAWLELNNGSGSTFLSQPYAVTILPRLRLRPARLRVSIAESVQVVATEPDIPGQYSLTWRADFGSVDSNGVFTAPPVAFPAYARVWACLLVNTECATTIIEVLPFRLATDPFILNPGETAHLQAYQGAGVVSAQWSSLTRNVSVFSDGTITAGSGLFDGGSAIVQAVYGGVIQQFHISISSPGSVAYTAEYLDWLGYDENASTSRLALGVFPQAVAVNGNWLYSISRSLPSYDGGPWLATWLDVYQLDARHNPVWVTSVEAPYNGGTLYIEGNSLYVVGQEGTGNSVSSLWIGYDITDGIPVFTGRQYFSGDPSSSYRRQGLGFALNLAAEGVTGSQNTISITDYSSGTTRTLPMNFQPISDPVVSGIAGSPGWAAVMFYYGTAGAETVFFDTTGSTAQPIADVPSGGFNSSITALQDLLVVGGDVYQIAGSSVNFVSHIPLTWVLTADPSTKRLLAQPYAFVQNEGVRVVDLTDAANPKLSAAAQFADFNIGGAALGPDYFALESGAQAVSIYPIVWSAGVQMVDNFPASSGMYALAIQGNYLYWTGPGAGAPGTGRTISPDFFEVVDLSATPSAVISSQSRPGDESGYSIVANGRYVYVGTDSELLVYNVTVPSAPILVDTVNEPSISMTLLGNYLYVGGVSGQHVAGESSYAPELAVFDISNPAAPRKVYATAVADIVWGIAAQPGWLAVTMGESGLQLFSLAYPAMPVPSWTNGDPAWDVKGAGDLMYVAQDTAGLRIMKVVQPSYPSYLSGFTLTTGDELAGEIPAAVAVTLDPRGIAWLCSSIEGRIYGIDIRVPGEQRPVSLLTTLGVVDAGQSATGVAGTELIVAGRNLGFDTSGNLNLGLFKVSDQTSAGQIQPDRSSDLPPLDRTKQSAQAHIRRVRAFRKKLPHGH